MGGMSFGHLVLLLIVVLVVFGAGKLPQVMKDMAKGVKAFKEGLKEGEDEPKDHSDTLPNNRSDAA
ncbi:MAG: twin-arginine translocase TatA/TatE family subunit [Alphaproteobacteria bacterium]